MFNNEMTENQAKEYLGINDMGNQINCRFTLSPKEYYKERPIEKGEKCTLLSKKIVLNIEKRPASKAEMNSQLRHADSVFIFSDSADIAKEHFFLPNLRQYDKSFLFAANDQSECDCLTEEFNKEGYSCYCINSLPITKDIIDALNNNKKVAIFIPQDAEQFTQLYKDVIMSIATAIKDKVDNNAKMNMEEIISPEFLFTIPNKEIGLKFSEDERAYLYLLNFHNNVGVHICVSDNDVNNLKDTVLEAWCNLSEIELFLGLNKETSPDVWYYIQHYIKPYDIHSHNVIEKAFSLLSKESVSEFPSGKALICPRGLGLVVDDSL